MLEKVGHIKNPLTVIAIFAGIAEISGTIVLPFISPENQSIYIWFLMFFPFYLVWVFFRTLNRDHTVLYAPSDYKDENNFVNPVVRSTPTEQANKLAEEAAEFATDPPRAPRIPAPPQKAQIRLRILLIKIQTRLPRCSLPKISIQTITKCNPIRLTMKT